MANRLCFIVNKDNKVETKQIEFKWIGGLAFSQRVKCASSLANSVKQTLPIYNHLEISTKSLNDTGIALSAFNLKLDGLPVESIYHSSRIYEDGTQYEFLKHYKPGDAKKFINENGKGKMIGFKYNEVEYPISPVTAFYNWIYINALAKSELSDDVLKYDAFTDIEFNDKRALNCQARAAALYVAIVRRKMENYFLSSFNRFLEAYALFVD